MRIQTIKCIKWAKKHFGKSIILWYSKKLLSEYRQLSWSGEYLKALCVELTVRGLYSKNMKTIRIIKIQRMEGVLCAELIEKEIKNMSSFEKTRWVMEAERLTADIQKNWICFGKIPSDRF